MSSVKILISQYWRIQTNLSLSLYNIRVKKKEKKLSVIYVPYNALRAIIARKIIYNFVKKRKKRRKKILYDQKYQEYYYMEYF